LRRLEPIAIRSAMTSWRDLGIDIGRELAICDRFSRATNQEIEKALSISTTIASGIDVLAH
jgi:hypothetical protein